ncbi:hypothetical protein T08_1707 [Trichinella sp. T8]|nr:hypothetical protein T08_1707 [Trichinella sp. T8]
MSESMRSNFNEGNLKSLSNVELTRIALNWLAAIKGKGQSDWALASQRSGPVAREGKIERRQVELSKEAFFISQKQLAICVSLNTKRNLIKQRHDGQLLTNVRFYYEYVRLI